MHPFIIKSNSGFFDIYDNGRIIYACKIKGKFRNSNIKPIVGDEVVLENGFILDVLSRRNNLKRPQISNIDQAIIICSIKEPIITIGMINQYLLSVIIKSITPILVFTKIELASDTEVEKMINIYSNLNIKCLGISNVTGEGINELKNILKNKKSVFLGQSGVGKSSLINSILPEFKKETDAISYKLGRGKHTTRITEFHQFDNGFIADTPGFSLLDNQEIIATELKEIFPGINLYFNFCKFRGCFHEKEPNCQVKKMVIEGKIDSQIYDDYLKQLSLAKERRKY